MAWKRMSMCTVEKTLGQGGFGEVICVRKKLDNQLYAIKVIAENVLENRADSKDEHLKLLENMMKEEAFLVMAMNHPNIIRVFGHFLEEGKIYQVMEYCESDMGNEIKLAEKTNMLFPEAKIYRWTKQLASAIAYLHDSGIVHADIKPSNVLVKSPNKDTICLTDYGIARLLQPGPSEPDAPIVGTAPYMAPEVVNGEHLQSRKRDVWAFGATVYEISTLRMLFNFQNFYSMNEVFAFKSLTNDRCNEIEQAKLKPDFVDYLDFVLNPDHGERPAMKAVLSHPYLDDLPRLFISYSWANKPQVLKIRDRLLEWHFKLWIDDQNMYGNITDRMAEAIEEATVVLICFSSGYAKSPNCKAEADYVFRLRKPFIPLKIEENYEPKGWLGMVLGNHLHYDFSKEDLFDTSFDKLVDGLRQKGRFPDEFGTSEAREANVKFEVARERTNPPRREPTENKTTNEPDLDLGTAKTEVLNNQSTDVSEPSETYIRPKNNMVEDGSIRVPDAESIPLNDVSTADIPETYTENYTEQVSKQQPRGTEEWTKPPPFEAETDFEQIEVEEGEDQQKGGVKTWSLLLSYNNKSLNQSFDYAEQFSDENAGDRTIEQRASEATGQEPTKSKSGRRVHKQTPKEPRVEKRQQPTVKKTSAPNGSPKLKHHATSKPITAGSNAGIGLSKSSHVADDTNTSRIKSGKNTTHTSK